MPKQRMNTLQQVLRRWANIPTRIICILVLLFQCCILDCYLVMHNNLVWCLWAVPDLLVVGLFIAALVLSYKYFQSDTRSAAQAGGELPLGYVAWGVYAIFLTCKIAIIFGMPEYIAQKLDEKDFFGANLLKTTISLSSVVYLLLVAAHHDAAPNSPRQALIKSISNGVAIDILDTVQFLDLLYTQKTRIIMTFNEHRAIIGISCINLILPTFLLLILSRTHYGRTSYSKRLKLLHTVLYLLLINLPMLVIRLYLWGVWSQDVSVFAIKNVIGIGQTVIVIHERLISVNEVDGSGFQPPPGETGESHTAMQPLSPAKEGTDQHDGAAETTTEL